MSNCPPLNAWRRGDVRRYQELPTLGVSRKLVSTGRVTSQSTREIRAWVAAPPDDRKRAPSGTPRPSQHRRHRKHGCIPCHRGGCQYFWPGDLRMRRPRVHHLMPATGEEQTPETPLRVRPSLSKISAMRFADTCGCVRSSTFRRVTAMIGSSTIHTGPVRWMTAACHSAAVQTGVPPGGSGTGPDVLVATRRRTGIEAFSQKRSGTAPRNRVGSSRYKRTGSGEDSCGARGRPTSGWWRTVSL
jgi:hypothetical protein